VHLYANTNSLINGIFSFQLRQWLEEFPPETIQNPYELADLMLKSLNEIYTLVKKYYKPTPLTPHYLFSFKDVVRVVQGVQILASKSKVVPTRVSRKSKFTSHF
jgi:hypothetical protein